MLILLGVLLALALVADRVAVRVAQSAVATRMQSDLKLPDKPAVRVHGFPFLTQLFGGRYDDVEVTARGVTAQQFTDLTVYAKLRGLHVPFSEVVSGESVRVAGTLTVFGQTFSASAHARAEVRDGTVIVTADHAQVLGVRLPNAALALVERGLSFALPVRNLPFGLRLTGVQVGATDLKVSAEADHVVLRKGEIPTGR